MLVLFCVGARYMLNRKSVNIAFLSIGIDYFQVLAMFSRSNVKWPDRECRCPVGCAVSGFSVPVSLCACLFWTMPCPLPASFTCRAFLQS